MIRRAWVTVLMIGCVVSAWAESPATLPAKGVCAHRGASATHPENTLAAFREAIRLGAQMIEFDVYLTKDGFPVIMHDVTVDRTTEGTGKVAELTLAEIKALDAGVWKGEAFKGERVPTLEETLAIMPENVWLNIHLKEGKACGARTARAVVEAGRLHQSFLACNAEAAAGAREVAPEIKICNMERQGGAAAYVDDTIARKAQFIQLAGTPVDLLAPLVAKLKSAGIRINYFGGEDPALLRRLFEAGVEFPLVNDVAAGLVVAGEFVD